MNRRAFLALAGSACTAAVAGCTSSSPTAAISEDGPLPAGVSLSTDSERIEFDRSALLDAHADALDQEVESFTYTVTETRDEYAPATALGDGVMGRHRKTATATTRWQVDRDAGRIHVTRERDGEVTYEYLATPDGVYSAPDSEEDPFLWTMGVESWDSALQQAFGSALFSLAPNYRDIATAGDFIGSTRPDDTIVRLRATNLAYQPQPLMRLFEEPDTPPISETVTDSGAEDLETGDLADVPPPVWKRPQPRQLSAFEATMDIESQRDLITEAGLAVEFGSGLGQVTEQSLDVRHEALNETTVEEPEWL